MKKQFTIFLILVFVLGLVPVNFSSAQDLSNRLSGKILLQVESVGQAWYIDPETKERAFLGRPADAFKIMRELGLGISEENYNSFNGYAHSRLSGKILLRVEANGEAYYVFPDDLKMYYLGRPADAFQIMREKGLGITNEDLNEVPIFKKYKEQTNTTKGEDSLNDENFNATEDLTIHYAKSLKLFEDYIEFIESNKSFVDLRVEHITNRINILNAGKLSEFTDPELSASNYYVIEYNEIIDKYIKEHQKDLDNNNIIINFLDTRRVKVNEIKYLYDTSKDALLNNLNIITSKKEFDEVLENYNSVFAPYLTVVKDSINQHMDAFREYANNFDDYYKGLDSQMSQLTSALSSLFSAQLNQYKIYEPIPQITVKQPSLLTPVYCTIDHTQFQSFVTCY